MIYIKSLDTVFIRPPKTGSTAMAMYVADSGLLNAKYDFASWEFDKDVWNQDGTVDMAYYYNTEHLFESGSALPQMIIEGVKKIVTSPLEVRRNLIHGTYAQGISGAKYSISAKCLSTIRHPIDRVLSVIHVDTSYVDTFNPTTTEINSFIAGQLDAPRPNLLFNDQYKSYNDAPTLWNIENIHEHATAYFATNGGVIRQRWYARRNGRKPPGIADQLTSEIKQKILTRYEKDFLLWEKAYAVYN